MTDTGAMSDAHPEPVSSDAHDEHAPGHEHAHAHESLGPVDVIAWAYAVVGSLAGLVVVLALFAARGT